MRIHARKDLLYITFDTVKLGVGRKKLVSYRKTYCCTVTGSTGESKENSKDDPDGDDEQSRPNEADDNEEGNLEDEGEDGDDETGQQEQGTQDIEETANLDLPGDLQLDEGGNEGGDGELPYFPLSIFGFVSGYANFLHLNSSRNGSQLHFVWFMAE